MRGRHRAVVGVLLLLVTTGAAGAQAPRYGYRGLVLGETPIRLAETIMGEALTCIRPKPAPAATAAPPTAELIQCTSASGPASPQQPLLSFVDGRLRAAHFLLPPDKIIEVVSAQVARIFPTPGESFRTVDGRRVWRSDPSRPVRAVVSEVRVRSGQGYRLAVLLVDERVDWRTGAPVTGAPPAGGAGSP